MIRAGIWHGRIRHSARSLAESGTPRTRSETWQRRGDLLRSRRDHLFGLVDRHGKAHSLGTAHAGRDDPDYRSICIKQWPTAVARVDSCVCRDQPCEVLLRLSRTVINDDSAIDPGDDSLGHGICESAEWAAYGNCQLSHPDGARIAQGYGCQPGDVYLDQGEVMEGISADQRSRNLTSVV